MAHLPLLAVSIGHDKGESLILPVQMGHMLFIASLGISITSTYVFFELMSRSLSGKQKSGTDLISGSSVLGTVPSGYRYSIGVV